MRALRLALAVLGLSVLALVALAGVAISGGSLWAHTPAGRAIVAGQIVGLLDRSLAGRFELGGLAVLPTGAVEISHLRVYDPEDNLVLEVTRARVAADVTRLRSRVLAVSVELESPSILLDEDEGGGLSLVRAFTPAEPTIEEPTSGTTFTVRLSELTVRAGQIWWQDAAGDTRLEVSDLEVDGRGGYGPTEADVELRLRGAMALPAAAPLALDVRASRHGDAVTLPLLEASLGATRFRVTGVGDLGRRSGRLALARVAVDRAQARALAPAVGEGADLAAHAYAESDGKLATAAAVVEPAGGSGTARAAVAVRVADLEAGGMPAAGLDVVLDALDPSRLLAALPAGAVTLTARGGASNTTLDGLTGRVEARLARSTLRGVALGPGELRAHAERGAVEVSRLALAAPGLSLEGTGRWRRRGALSGRLAVEGNDLAATARAAALLTGEPVLPMSGTYRLEAALAGTGAAPAFTATLTAPALAYDTTALRGLTARFAGQGPLSVPGGEVELTADALRSGGDELLRRVALRATLVGREAGVTASALAPSLGTDPVTLSARGTLDEPRERLAVSELTLAWPGERWSLAAPATVVLAGPSVDRLELASGDQRLVLEGGLDGSRLEAGVQARRLDLARLPRGLLPGATAGRLTLDARAEGTTARPNARASFSLEDGAVAGLDVSARGEAGWDGRGRRARLAAEVERRQGGRIEVHGELPVPLAVRRAEPLALSVTADALPLAEALIAAGLDLPLDGKVGIEARLSGTTAAPTFTATATLADAAWEDLYPVDARVALEAPGETLGVVGQLSLDGRRLLVVDASLPLDLADALARPEAVAESLREAPLRAALDVPGFDLAAIGGALDVPRDLTGRLDGRAELAGTIAAPRGTVTLAVTGAAVAGYRELAARLDGELLAREVRLAAGASIGGAELLRATASLAAPPERLAEEGALGKAPFRLAAEVPRVELARASSPGVALGGTLSGSASVEGTLAAPSLEASLSGQDVTVQGRPLGALDAAATYAAGKAEGMMALRPGAGGELRAIATLEARIGLGVETDYARAPLDASLVAENLDLGFLPAVAPGVVREAHGKLVGEVRARGPLSRPTPRGRLTLEDGRIAVSEYGDWSRIGLDLEVNDDALELRKLDARRGKGRFHAEGSVRGLATRSAAIAATARFDGLTLARAGMDLATLDLSMSATGTWDGTLADVEMRVPGGTVQLPRRVPRTLQSLERRKDIVVGRPRERRRPPRAPRPGEASAGVEPLRLVLRTVVPGQLFVKGDDPRINVELKADVTYERSGEEEYASGEISVVRGFVEPFGGRVFELVRGNVQFTGGPPTAAYVDVEARWRSPEGILVTVLVAGPALEPQIDLSSQPQLDQAQIALLIATGRTELKRGSGEVASLTATDAASQALSAVVSTAFKSMLAGKLPIDTISLDASSVRAGTYLPNSKIYVGYVYRFDAAIEEGENQNEVSVEYQISPRWTLESRYGDGQSGSASLIWSKDF